MSAPTDDPSDQPVDELSFEDAVDALETIITRIERGEIGLEASLLERQRGEALIRRCRSILDHAEQEITRLEDADEGAA